LAGAEGEVRDEELPGGEQGDCCAMRNGKVIVIRARVKLFAWRVEE
jgi:hypothetical protein